MTDEREHADRIDRYWRQYRVAIAHEVDAPERYADAFLEVIRGHAADASPRASLPLDRNTVDLEPGPPQ